MVMHKIKRVHGYDINEGWVCVSIKTLDESNVPCWEDYPTHSEEVEEGSFCAWPVDQLITTDCLGKVHF